MALKTTTWKDRNVDNLERTKVFAIEKEMKYPSLINFGPGGSVVFLAKHLPVGKTKDLNLWKHFIRVFESFLRKTGMFRLKTTEPYEIARIFGSLKPEKLSIFDLEKKVIAAVNDVVAEGNIGFPLEASVKDIMEGPVGVEADIVIALNIIARTSNREVALKNILSSVRQGGLVCINIEQAPEGFRKLGSCVFEREKNT